MAELLILDTGGDLRGSLFTVQFDGSYTLRPGESIYSPNKNQELCMEKNGDLVNYFLKEDGSRAETLWESKTKGNSGAYAEFQGDGNLVVYDVGTPRKALWASKTDLTGTNNYGKGVLFTLPDLDTMFITVQKTIQTTQQTILPLI